MLKKCFLILSVAVIANLIITFTSLAQTSADDKLVYVLSSAVSFDFSINGKFIAVEDNGLTASNPPGLSNTDNWIVRTEAIVDIVNAAGNVTEPRGNITQFKPVVVRRYNPQSAGLLAVEIGRQIDLTKYKVTFTFQPTGAVLTRIKQFSKIDVSFADSFPEDPVLQNTQNWLVRSIDLTTGIESDLKPVSAIVDPDRLQRLVSLEMGQILDRTTQKIVVRFLQPNFPEFTIGEPQKTGLKKIYTAAKGKDDADIYFNGKAVGAKNSKPLYSIESKFSYLQSLGRKGAIGGKISADFSEESNLDPDSIIATGTYEKIFLLGPPSTGIRFVADFLGGEFDRENKTRNLVTGAYGILILPSKKFNDNNFVTAEFMGGFEAGRNYRNSLIENGIGNFWRPKFGINVYYLSLNPGPLNRITASAEYKMRLPQSAEPFTQIINGEESTFLTKKPRHDYQFSLDFMFSKAFGISVQHRYGSVPPVFNLVDNKVSLGLVFKLKQANK